MMYLGDGTVNLCVVNCSNSMPKFRKAGLQPVFILLMWMLIRWNINNTRRRSSQTPSSNVPSYTIHFQQAHHFQTYSRRGGRRQLRVPKVPFKQGPQKWNWKMQELMLCSTDSTYYGACRVGWFLTVEELSWCISCLDIWISRKGITICGSPMTLHIKGHN